MACCLALMILLSGLPVPAIASDPTSPPEPSESVESQLEESLPTEFLPEETLPEESLPAETLPEESLPAESLPEETLPSVTLSCQEEPEISGPGLYFGMLHAHSSISDGTSSAEDLFLTASQIPGLDFFAVTDHSDSFDHHKDGSIGTDGSTVSADWTAGKAAAKAATTDSFVGIYGYEMSWPANMQIGHISTFGTPGFQSWQQDDYSKYNSALENYYGALSSIPDSISQFNHPGSQYGTFLDFEYSEAADQAVTLLETGSGTNAYDYYTTALDLGWHLAPSGNRENTSRTVVYAQSLTEADLYDALRHCRVYATQDPDLEILYTMNSHFMGSRLKSRHLGDHIQISVSLNDPGDETIGLVEVITNGGNIAAYQTLSASSGTLDFSLPMNSGYYYLRIIQTDGDTAVTAPIWVDAEEHLGISDFVCETPVPVQNESVCLKLNLYNGESADFHITTLEVLADGVPVNVQSDLSGIPAGSNLSHTFSVTADCMGVTELTARLTGTLEGTSRTYEASLKVNFHRSEQVTSIVIDGSHGNASLDQLAILKQIALKEQIRVTVTESIPSPAHLERCRFLLVSAPSEPFSDTFLNAVSEFAGYGGSIIICGQAASPDDGAHSAAELNRLLKAIGSTMYLDTNIIEDPVNNQTDPHLLFADDFNYNSTWCDGISENQVYRFSCGCSVNPGTGIWLVKGCSTSGVADLSNDDSGSPVLLACESLSGGGTVFASGSLFLTDANLEEPENIFAESLANRTIVQNLLSIGGDVLPLSSISQARTAPPGTLVRIRGYATTSTSNPHNTFPDMLYLQDDTGGIVITPFQAENIQQGTPLEIVGFAGNPGANRALKLNRFTVLDAEPYQHPPLEGSWTALLDPTSNSQRLIQVEGICREIYCRVDDSFSGCLLVDDDQNTIRIKVEDYIFNGSDDENELHKKIRKGRAVRAIGLLHVNEYGETVLRVRNCEEVVWVPPLNYWNPPTGDILLPFAVFCACTSLTALLFLRKRKTA